MSEQAQEEKYYKEYYDLQDILKFLGFDYKFSVGERYHDYPFNRSPKDIEFNWGQILIPKYGIRETVQNKLSNKPDKPITEIKMVYQIAYLQKSSGKVGVINQDISLGFRYDKEWKYGDVRYSIYEVCFWILENAVRTNDFFIIRDEAVLEFFSRYIIPCQYGIGRTVNCSSPQETYTPGSSNEDEEADSEVSD